MFAKVIVAEGPRVDTPNRWSPGKRGNYTQICEGASGEALTVVVGGRR